MVKNLADLCTAYDAQRDYVVFSMLSDFVARA